MKKYPYIGEHVTSPIINLFTSEGRGIRLHPGDSCDGKEYPCETEGLFNNATREYLQNTCGEVVSTEHAEFIIELAENAGLEVYIDSPEINRSFFAFNEYSCLFFYSAEESINKRRCRKITIPLPPKEIGNEESSSDEETELKSRAMASELNNESKDDWPVVGSYVSLRYKFDSKRIMYTGELLYLSSNHIIIKSENNNDCYCIRGEWDIEKPKSKEDLLIEELQTKLCNNNAVDNYILACGIINGDIAGLVYSGGDE